jgi:hypothetical protein
LRDLLLPYGNKSLVLPEDSDISMVGGAGRDKYLIFTSYRPLATRLVVLSSMVRGRKPHPTNSVGEEEDFFSSSSSSAILASSPRSDELPPFLVKTAFARPPLLAIRSDHFFFTLTLILYTDLQSLCSSISKAI